MNEMTLWKCLTKLMYSLNKKCVLLCRFLRLINIQRQLLNRKFALCTGHLFYERRRCPRSGLVIWKRPNKYAWRIFSIKSIFFVIFFSHKHLYNGTHQIQRGFYCSSHFAKRQKIKKQMQDFSTARAWRGLTFCRRAVTLPPLLPANVN